MAVINLPDWKLANRTSVQCTRYTSALDWAQANQAAYLVPTYVYKSFPMVEILTILPEHFEE